MPPEAAEVGKSTAWGAAEEGVFWFGRGPLRRPCLLCAAAVEEAAAAGTFMLNLKFNVFLFQNLCSHVILKKLFSVSGFRQ